MRADLARPSADDRRPWPDYAAVWRWHFYAGLICLPFVCWLAVTGSVYLFRPDIEAWLDRPYESLRLVGPRPPPSSEARAALAAVPGSVFSRYEPPATPTGAAQVVVARNGRPYRVYVDPADLRAMRVARDDERPMDVLAHLHGQLLLGDRGSMLVELAASWGVVMILTGLYLWFPRAPKRLGGVLYPRLGRGGRQFWRDLHAVTGLWVSLVTLFMLLSGLPWAASWGNYLTWARNLWSVTAGAPDWPVGATDQSAAGRNQAPDLPARAMSAMPGMTHAETAAAPVSAPAARSGARAAVDLRALDRVAPLAARLQAPRPVWISPSARGAGDWIISSQAQDRPLRVTYKVSPDRGEVIETTAFARENVVDQVVNVAIATHEGQFFGRLNQAILLLTAAGLLLVSVSATVMWWRRRPAHQLGAPSAGARPRFSGLLAVGVGALALVLPLFGLSLVLLLSIDWVVLRRLPELRRWLGLSPRAA